MFAIGLLGEFVCSCTGIQTGGYRGALHVMQDDDFALSLSLIDGFETVTTSIEVRLLAFQWHDIEPDRLRITGIDGRLDLMRIVPKPWSRNRRGSKTKQTDKDDLNFGACLIVTEPCGQSSSSHDAHPPAILDGLITDEVFDIAADDVDDVWDPAGELAMGQDS